MAAVAENSPVWEALISLCILVISTIYRFKTSSSQMSVPVTSHILNREQSTFRAELAQNCLPLER